MRSSLGGPEHTVRRAGELARGLSAGRRRGARLALGRGAAVWTDLRHVYLPWPPPAELLDHRQGLAACVALQVSPTKDVVAALCADDFSPRRLAALQLCEAAAAISWVGEMWPGLQGAVQHITGLRAEPWRDVDAQAFAERARELALRRGPLHVPPVLGLLPLRRRPAGSFQRLLRRFGVRRAGDAMEHLGSVFGGLAVEGLDDDEPGDTPLAGEGHDETDDRERVGTPYPEWDMTAQDYRKDYVTVWERRRAARTGTPGRPRADLGAWFAAPLDRVWRGRLDDGAEIDIDATVDGLMDTLAGLQPSERVYRDRLRVERDVCCAVLIDSSGSLGREAMIDHSLDCADALVDAMDQAGERHAVFSFSSDGRHDVVVEVLQDFHDSAVAPSAADLRSGGYTRLGAALRHVTARVLAEQARRRAVLVISDGVPFDEAYEGDYACADVGKAVEEAERHSVVVLVLGVGDGGQPLRSILGERFVPVPTLDDLAPALGGVHIRLVTA